MKHECLVEELALFIIGDRGAFSIEGIQTRAAWGDVGGAQNPEEYRVTAIHNQTTPLCVSGKLDNLARPCTAELSLWPSDYGGTALDQAILIAFAQQFDYA